MFHETEQTRKRYPYLLLVKSFLPQFYDLFCKRLLVTLANLHPIIVEDKAQESDAHPRRSNLIIRVYDTVIVAI